MKVRKKAAPIYIGCAGWSIPRRHVEHFATDGSHLERCAGRFNAVEINSSFYRAHRPQTYAKWAACVPDQFRFAVKIPKRITHEQKLIDVTSLETFINEVTSLGDKLGALLVQLPPSLAFDYKVVSEFFVILRIHFSGYVVCEPRHPTWFASEAEKLLVDFKVARVAADPAPVEEAAVSGGWDGLIYYRLHGSPRMYYSIYTDKYLESLAGTLHKSAARGVPTWCIFDNTAMDAATINALQMMELLCKRES